MSTREILSALDGAHLVKFDEEHGVVFVWFGGNHLEMYLADRRGLDLYMSLDCRISDPDCKLRIPTRSEVFDIVASKIAILRTVLVRLEAAPTVEFMDDTWRLAQQLRARQHA